MLFRSMVLLLLLSFVREARGQMQSSLFDSLYASQDIELRLTYPFDSLYRTQREEIDAIVSLRTKAGVLLDEQPMTLNLRGKFRRMKCLMPPLMLNFKKSSLREMGVWANADEIKLVTHCLEGEEGQENLQEERLCYQLYETLTPFSYRTIWLTVQYIDASGKNPTITSAGFLLEPDKVLSARLDLEEQKIFNVTEDSLDFVTFAHAVAFNFLVGNRDWSIVASRNAKLFFDHRTARYKVIPYDFDYANIVGATYRRESLPKSLVHPFDRMFTGEYYASRTAEILQIAMRTKMQILDKVMTAENPMDTGRRKKINRYFETWYQQLEKSDPASLQYGLVCPYKGGL